MKRYPESAIWDEVAYLAYHLHWSFDDLLDLDHRQRARLLRRVADLDRRGDRPGVGAERGAIR